MSGSTQRRLKSEISCGNNLDDADEGTAARTRPLSYEEIMLKRKTKKELDVKHSRDEAWDVKRTRHEGTVMNPGDHRRDTSPNVKKKSRNNAPEDTYRKKEEKISRTEDSHSKSKNKENHDGEGRSKHKHDGEGRSKHKHEKDARTTINMLKNDSRGHGRSRLDEYPRDDTRYDNEKRHYKESAPHDRYMERNRGALENDKKRKERSGEDEKYKVRDPVKKHDSGNRRDFEISEKKEKMDMSRSHHDERRLKRRRSKSQDHVKDKGRRSRSSSPKIHKNVSSHGHDHDQPSLHSQRNKSGRHIDTDRNNKGRRSRSSSPKIHKNASSHGHDHDQRSLHSQRDKSARHIDTDGNNKGRRSRSSSPKMHKNVSSQVHDHDQLSLHSQREKSGRHIDTDRSNKGRRSRSSSPKVQKNVSSHGHDHEQLSLRSQRDKSERHIDTDRKNKGRRSRSSSPKIHKNVSSHGHDHDQLSLRSQRDKSGRHIDTDRNNKGRRSRSSSPNILKIVSSHSHDHDQISLHPQRDKSERHIDTDRSNKIPTNGSTNQRRLSGSSSGLGGYSPRKRKTEAAIKTPSPIHSPERKNSAGWDLPPSGADKISASVASAPQLLLQTKSSHTNELAVGVSFPSTTEKPLSAILPSNLSAFHVTSIDSIQLTQATRPMRRLYIDNIPGSASEKEIMECFNDFLVSSGANRILGRRPCISCMIHKEKGQALVEFLTPEDASAALFFDGRYLFGSVVRIRRPKDFVEVASMPAYNNYQNRNYKDNIRQSGPLESSKHEDDAISNFVTDSFHKIFIGGIAEGLSSQMIMEIVSTFGPLKAYHFETNAELNEQCVFVEYADQSVTLKACAGLNGMKLGGGVLTVAQAVPNTSFMENSEKVPFYGVPEHLKPLLEMPTQVLKLSNVLDQHAVKLLSETDMEEIVEDVRLECSRFGSVVSINVIRTSDKHDAISGRKEVSGDMEPLERLVGRDLQEQPAIEDLMGGDVDHGDGNELKLPSNVEEYENVKNGEKHGLDDENSTNITVVEDPANDPQELGMGTVEDTEKSDGSDVNHQEMPINESGVKSELNPDEYVGVGELVNDKPFSVDDVPELDKTSDKVQDIDQIANPSAVLNQEVSGNGVKNESICDFENVFEVGCVLVEFKRTEASCMAAHCLHGRVFDDRVVTIKYVPLDAYRSRFPK